MVVPGHCRDSSGSRNSHLWALVPTRRTALPRSQAGLSAWREVPGLSSTIRPARTSNRYSTQHTKVSGWRDTECIFGICASRTCYLAVTRQGTVRRNVTYVHVLRSILQPSCGNAGRAKDIDAVFCCKSTQSLYVRGLARRRRQGESPSRLSTGAHETLETSRFCDQQEAGTLG
jgi:hypothetical protein